MIEFLNWKPCSEENYPSDEERIRTVIACPNGNGFDYHLFHENNYGWNVLERMEAKVAILPNPGENSEDKKIYLVVTKVFNGTVPMNMYISSYPNKGLAEKVKQAVDRKNKDNELKFNIITEVLTTSYFDNELNIPILNEV